VREDMRDSGEDVEDRKFLETDELRKAKLLVEEARKKS